MGEWREAAGWLRQAIAERPEESGEKIRVYGMKWERYLPSYHLGMVLYQLGDCHAALAAFERARSQGAVGMVGRGWMKSREEDCQMRLAASSGPPIPRPTPSSTPGTRPNSGSSAPPAPRPRPATPTRPPIPLPAPQTTEEARWEALKQKVTAAEELLRRAGEVAGAVDAYLERTRNAAFRREPALEERYQTAYRRLNNARFVLKAGRKENDFEAVSRAGAEAEAALAELEAVAREAGVTSR